MRLLRSFIRANVPVMSFREKCRLSSEASAAMKGTQVGFMAELLTS